MQTNTSARRFTLRKRKHKRSTRIPSLCTKAMHKGIAPARCVVYLLCACVLRTQPNQHCLPGRPQGVCEQQRALAMCAHNTHPRRCRQVSIWLNKKRLTPWPWPPKKTETATAFIIPLHAPVDAELMLLMAIR